MLRAYVLHVSHHPTVLSAGPFPVLLFLALSFHVYTVPCMKS